MLHFYYILDSEIRTSCVLASSPSEPNLQTTSRSLFPAVSRPYASASHSSTSTAHGSYPSAACETQSLPAPIPQRPVYRWDSSPVSELLVSATGTSRTSKNIQTTPTKRRLDKETTLDLHRASPTTPSTRLSSLDLGISSPIKRCRSLDPLFNTRHSDGDGVGSSEAGTARSEPEETSVLSDTLLGEIAAKDISMTSDFNDCLLILQKAERNGRASQTNS